jgi:hypothetical protein
LLRSPLVLAADMTASDALARVRVWPVHAAVVVRRQLSLDLLFYTFAVRELAAELAGAPASQALETALRLDGRPPAPTRDLADPGAPGENGFEGVLLDGVSILGVQAPERPDADAVMVFSKGILEDHAPAPPAQAPDETMEDLEGAPATPAASPEPDRQASPSDPGSRQGYTRGIRPPPSGPGEYTRVIRGAEPRPDFEGEPPPESAGSRGGFLSRLLGGGRGGPTRSAGSAPGGGGKPIPPPSAAEPDAPSTGSGSRPAGSRSGEGVAPGVEPSPQTRFEAHPLLETDKDVLEPGEPFDLVIGLAREAVEGVSGSMVSAAVPADAEHLDFDVQVVADEFEAPAGWYFRLRVSVADPGSARIAVPLVAPGGTAVRQSLLEVHFSHGGVPAGVAFRRVAVRPAGVERVEEGGGEASAAAHGHAVPWLQPTSSPDLLVDPADPPPDLWITISKPDGNEATGRFVWSFQSPHPIELPREPMPMDLGDDARTFAGRMIRLVAENEGSELLDEALGGLGMQIRDKAPAELGPVLDRLHAHVRDASGRPATILLQSAEAHVPWELAVLENPPDADRPPFLGAQFAVGRWLLGPRSVRVPPAREVAVRSMAVVVGDYKSSRRLRPLPQAEAEGETLADRYGAHRLAATAPELNLLFGGGPDTGVDAIHFACHGEVDPNDAATGKVFLNDDQPLDPVHFLQARVGRTHEPFLFLNACQVGQAGESLGDYAGFAGSCLRNGFRGFVAPLWSVDDGIAHAIALDFYERAFGPDDGAPTPVAEVLRDVRARFPEDVDIPPSTWLAYVFYGNPRLILRRA